MERRSVLPLLADLLTRQPLPLRALAFYLAYILCAAVSQGLSGTSGSFASIWLPSGLCLGILLLSGPRARPWLILTAVLANVTFDLLDGRPVWASVLFTTGNVSEAVVGAWLVRRYVSERPTLTTLRETVGLLGYSALPGTAFGAALGTLGIGLMGAATPAWHLWLLRWGSHAAGILLLTSALLAWTATPSPATGRGHPRRRLEVALLAGAVSAGAWLASAGASATGGVSVFLLMPLMTWAGLRFGPRGASAAAMLLAMELALFTAGSQGSSAVSSLSAFLHAAAQQGLLVTAALSGLIPAAMLAERQRIEEAYTLLHQAVEHSAESIMITDVDGVVQYVNPAFERLAGYTRAEAIGQKPSLLKSGRHEKAFYRNLWGALAQGEVWRGVLVNRRKDGRLYEAQAVISPVSDTSGRLVNFVAVTNDVTRQREMEAQLRQSQKMDAVGRLAGGIAHDFNNLLLLILGSAKIIQEERPDLDPQSRELLSEIQLAGRRAAELVEQLLAFSRRQPRQPRVLDLNASLSRLERMLGRVLGERIRLVTDLAAAPAQVRADPDQLEQIIVTLAVNARDAMPDGGRLTIETANVRESDSDELRLHAGHAIRLPAVRLSVRDTGAGMNEETLQHLFEPFYTTKARGEGTGLGLATVYGIVEQNDGAIWVESALGRGSVFNICLPLSTEPLTVEPALPAASPTPRGSETILLVEDEAPVRWFTHRLLRRLGYDVIEAASGPDALALSDAHQEKIHLLLTDVVMPEMSGTDLSRLLTARRTDMRVLYMSGHVSDMLDSYEGLDPQTTLLRKPFAPEDLARRIREILDR